MISASGRNRVVVMGVDSGEIGYILHGVEIGRWTVWRKGYSKVLVLAHGFYLRPCEARCLLDPVVLDGRVRNGP